MAGRGRPKGRSSKGQQTEQHLYQTALQLFAERGYEETTLRDIAKAAGLRPGLIYRYFPSKRAVVVTLYNQLTEAYLQKTKDLEKGGWYGRFVDTLKISLDTLKPHREILSALTPVLVSRSDEGVFAPQTSFSRDKVVDSFEKALHEAEDPAPKLKGLAWLLYLLHIAVILWWLLDRSEQQKGTEKLLAFLEGGEMMVVMALKLPFAGTIVGQLAEVSKLALLGENPE